MLDVLKDGSKKAAARLETLESRAEDSARVEPVVADILRSVRRDGDAALVRLTKKFDGVSLDRRSLIVGKRDLERAEKQVPAATRTALRTAYRRITRFHKHQCERGFEISEDGLRLGMRVTPLARAGVYVPGGSAAYPSSVLMNIVPARVAGVDDITVVTPPSPDGIRPEVLFAARLAGADRVVQVGGAQAVGALAYGTDSVERVDKIVGPGNVYVATAKRLVFGVVDIDMVAGPSEVLIIADDSADPRFVAADMLAQAEHDPLAAAICIATSAQVAGRVVAEVERQLAELERRAIAEKSIERFGTVLAVDSVERAAEIADDIAPEHLELFVRRPRRLASRIRNAGAIFLGQYAAEALGDYAAGPNHVLPTGGAARFSSPLGVYDFVKRTSIIEATRAGFERLAPTVERLALSEGLEGHARSVTRRLENGRSKRRKS